MSEARDYKAGLRLLSPPLRLAFVITTTSALLLLNDLWHIIPATLIAFALFAFSPSPPWRTMLTIILPTAVLYFVGNLLFSPPDVNEWTFLIFHISRSGAEIALARGLRIGAILLVSLAWLACTPLPELYDSLAVFPRLEPGALGVVRGLQLTRREFILIAQSLRIRGMRFQTLFSIALSGNWTQLHGNVLTFLALLRAIIPRQLSRIAKATLAWERHHPEDLKFVGSDLAIEGKELFIRYNRHQAPIVHHSSFSINKGTFIYIAGAARSGKSTLLRALGSIIPRITGELAGTISIVGVDTTALSLREVAALASYFDSDATGNVLGLTVGQEVLLLAKSEQRARECLRTIGIEDLWSRETTKLSGGQQVRLLLAGLLASDAPVLLLDDPLDQLDPAGRDDFIAALRTLRNRRDKTILVTDWHLEAFLPDIDAVLPLKGGTVQPLVPAQYLRDPECIACWGLEKPRLHQRIRTSCGARPLAGLYGVSVVLDGILILKGVDFQVLEGECVIVQGPNGSGKTTAMLTLAGGITPTTGRVDVRGQVGYLFQDAAYQVVAPTTYDELSIAPHLRGCSLEKVRSLVSSALAWTGLNGSESPLDLHPQDLKLLALAAMGMDANIIILDEPTVGLDATGVRKVIEFAHDLLDKGAAVIIITHEDSLVRLGDRVVWFHDGCIQSETSTNDLCRRKSLLR